MTLSAGSQSGEIELDLVSAVRGCNRSGDRARRKSGEPGSEVLQGRPKDPEDVAFLPQQLDAPTESAHPLPLPGPPLGVDNSDDGLYDCVVLELPGWWPVENVKGLGDRVGDCGSGEGDGVLARGDSGICPTDLRLFGECKFLVTECSLCLSPCRVDGLW